ISLAVLLLVVIAFPIHAASVDKAPPAPVATVYPFEFHSGFWINLHHFLYEQALLQKKNKGAAQTTATQTASANALPPEEQQLWQSAVDYYMANIIKRDLLFDQDLVTINDQLGESENASNLSQSGVNPDLAKILESVAPIYRTQWWPQHDRANRFWIAVVT